MMKDASELRQHLAHFYGTERWFRHALVRSVLYTEGAQAFFEHAGGGAYWFLDVIATEHLRLMREHGYLRITLTVNEDASARIEVTDGNRPLTQRELTWTDCPPGEWPLLFIDNVIMLPSEY